MMATSIFRTRLSSPPDVSLCARCTFRLSHPSRIETRRWVARLSVENKTRAKEEWQAQAVEIRAGRQKSMLTKLEERGLVHTVAGKREEVDEMLIKSRVGVYVGIDPTASSLHIGHMLPLMALFWMHVHGYHTISLVGGATAKIGDPTGRLTTREKTAKETRAENLAKMNSQLKNLWVNVVAYGKKYGYQHNIAWRRALLNNNAWLNSLSMMEFLQVMGTGMRMGPMLARDTVKNKMKNGDGMSFAEFTYPLLQAWDWWHMYQSLGIQMQIGGSDQYGNITAGIDAVKHIASNHHDPLARQEAERTGTPFGFTVPLLTTSSGQKFGKSAGNAIWLDPDQTSSFDLYKFFLGTPDDVVGKYLKLFTFMPIEQIDELVKEHMEDASRRVAQHTLAREFVELAHGEGEARQAETQHRLIFGKNTSNLEEYNAAQQASESSTEGGVPSQQTRVAPHLKLPCSAFETTNIGKVALACGLVESSSAGHQLAKDGGFFVTALNQGSMNDGSLSYTPKKRWEVGDMKRHLLDENLLIFRRGKREVRIVEVVTDEEYENLGLAYSGMPVRGNDGGADAENLATSEGLKRTRG